MISISRATVNDLDSVTLLFMGYLEFQKQSHTRDEARSFLAARLEQDESKIYLAHHGGDEVGLAQVYPVFSSVSLRPAWILNDLYVAHSVRGLGVGRELLQRVLADANLIGAAYVTLETGEDNSTAQALYESEGFTLDPQTRNYTSVL